MLRHGQFGIQKIALNAIKDDTSIYKQYTYARNVTQRNLDIFNKRNEHTTHSIVRLKDDDTEGYNVIPYFFISARLDKHYNYKEDSLQESDKNETRRKNFQFKNRLFDRDTLLLFHYDVNFLIVLSMYGKNNTSEIRQ